MKYYPTQEIAELARQQLPIKYTDLNAKVEQYHSMVFSEILRGYSLANMRQINQGVVPFNITHIRKQLGRYGKGGKGYWWNWLHSNFPLVNIKSKGNSIQGVSSMAEPKDIPIDIILAGANGKELVHAVYDQYGDADIDLAPINTRSLENYVLATTAERNLHPTVQDNLKSARIILAIARECKGVLPQVKSHSVFGRTYYKGVNLQNVHKTVRHAALGDCYSVDIDSSVFNWKYAMCPFSHELTYTRELIQDKQRVRKQLAHLVFGNTTTRSINTIKQVLTAVSFGARAETKCWFKNEHNQWTQGAVSEIIKSKELRDCLFKHSWMQEFMREQEKINKYLGDSLAQAAREGVIPQKYLADLKSERGRISKHKLIAWSYQHSEQQVMQQLLDESGAPVILQVHDGVYFKSKPDMPSMQTVLQEQWPLATLSIEKINCYEYHNWEISQEHAEHIQQEELAANQGVDPRTTPVHTAHPAANTQDPHCEPNWDLMQQEQLEEYLTLFPRERPFDSNMPEFAKQRLS